MNHRNRNRHPPIPSLLPRILPLNLGNFGLGLPNGLLNQGRLYIIGIELIIHVDLVLSVEVAHHFLF